MSTDRRGLVVAALGAIYLIWGSTFLGVKIALEAFPPFFLGATRFLLAGTVLFVWAAFRAPVSRPARHEWRAAYTSGGLMLVGGLGSVVIATQFIDTGLTALLSASVPLWMAVLDRWRYGQRMRRTSVAGMLVGFAAVGFLVSPSGGGTGPLWASVLVVLGGLAWAAGSLYSREAPLPGRQRVATSMQMLAAASIFLVLSGASGEFARLDPAAFGWRPLLAFAYLVVVGSLVGFTAYTWLLTAVPSSIVATYAYVNPVVALVLGWAVLGERVGSATLAASTVVVLSVALMVGRRPRRAVPQ
ncbi:MAG: EamA family transporter, partial [Nitriliruptorales bacterium]